jgi:transcriptional regulator GlxA family with amidase domain
MVEWFSAMHKSGATLCSACSGIFLLAETGLFDGQETTVHWGYAQAFTDAFPAVPSSPEQVLIASGVRGELITSGAAHTWHDLVLYLIARYVSAPAAQSIAKFFALQWHRDGMAPYMKFDFPTNHGDAIIADGQRWLATNFAMANPVDEVTKHSRLTPRSFSRRFNKATGRSPMAYVQRLRMEDAKRRLERTTEPVDKISWLVGYEDASYFRRVFKRIVGITPASYRRKFQGPAYTQNNGV